MVLGLKIPDGDGLKAIKPLMPAFLSYVLSFIYLGIYWNNHHHMVHTVRKVTGSILCANLHLLFWLSLVPFTTAWMGENHFAAIPVAFYGGILFMAAVAYFILQGLIIGSHGKDSILKKAVGKDVKGKLSLFFYGAAIGCSFWLPWISLSLYSLVALIWLVPDKRIEKVMPTE